MCNPTYCACVVTPCQQYWPWVISEIIHPKYCESCTVIDDDGVKVQHIDADELITFVVKDEFFGSGVDWISPLHVPNKFHFQQVPAASVKAGIQPTLAVGSHLIIWAIGIYQAMPESVLSASCKKAISAFISIPMQ